MTLKEEVLVRHDAGRPADGNAPLQRRQRLRGHPLRRLGLRLRRQTFTLDTDEDAGVALRTCTACGNEHYMGDSASYADEAEPARHLRVRRRSVRTAVGRRPV